MRTSKPKLQGSGNATARYYWDPIIATTQSPWKSRRNVKWSTYTGLHYAYNIGRAHANTQYTCRVAIHVCPGPQRQEHVYYRVC